MTTVTRTPEFSLQRTLKPFPGFEALYDSRDPDEYPLVLPGTLDSNAGKPGYDPNLLAGIPVPMGARVKLWLPRLQSPLPYGGGGSSPSNNPPYIYYLCWRVRALTEAIQSPDQYTNAHFGQLLQGRPQLAGAPPYDQISAAGPRYVLPAAITTVQWHNNVAVVANGTQPFLAANPLVTTKDPAIFLTTGFEYAPASLTSEPAQVNVNSASFVMAPPATWAAPITQNFTGSSLVPGAPIKAGASGLLSQGYYPDGNGTATPPFSNSNCANKAGPIYDVVNVEAEGDELLVLLTRKKNYQNGASADWDFSGVDSGLATIFGAGSPANSGMYIFTGSPV